MAGVLDGRVGRGGFGGQAPDQPLSDRIPGRTKIRRRDTTETIVGAITGTLTRPGLLVLGRHDQDGRLRAVGRTVPLRPDAARQVAEHLTAAAPGHPWTGAKFSATWGAATSSTPPWSTLPWWPRSARIALSTAAASSGTRSGSSGCLLAFAVHPSSGSVAPVV
ncbi:hypothetical protein ACIQK6_41130 [Streptomyces sp. NPDC091682]|uniref:hypothetical protein n=1 Tax=Streptomyces sp. NPDC091682 TaxID=3366005 RepID=UPI0038089F1A